MTPATTTSAVLANLFMENLETEKFSTLIPNTVTWLRYVDDVLVFYPRHLNIQALLNKINAVEPSIKFTLELENNGKLPFLDVLLYRSPDSDKLLFKVYRKPTNKDDLIHFY
nr:uncharacterized protein LOC128698052 [Cherax quadricarinatus]